ncbi:MAG: R3H domain-containing nucleic acid-binding protein [bacterium]|nr:R3H domain-containing nucleic acid-binding protein [bacterium]
MLTEEDLQLIKGKTEEFLQKMNMGDFSVEAKHALVENKFKNFDSLKVIDGLEANPQSSASRADMEAVDVDVRISEAQFLIGQNGQTLLEFQRMLRMLLNKKLGKNFYLNVDINEYKKKKIEYLKDLAVSAADEVFTTKQKKVMSPMSAYERRIIHAQLAGRQDVTTQSQGEGFDRCVVIAPK